MTTTYRDQLERLIAGTLDGRSFRHADHVGVAYEALSAHDFFEALQLVGAGIRRMANAQGEPEKFNATITQAFFSLIAERMQAGAYRDAEDFLAANPDLLRSEALSAWYSKPRLTSPLARRVALLPDRVSGPA